MLEVAEAVPAGVYVGAVVIFSAAARFVFASNKPAPWIFTDSLIYGELGKSFATTGHFALREVAGKAGFGVVYPILLSPSYALFSSVPQAFAAMKATNCIVMSLAAVGTYLLARTLVGRWLALLAAMLAVAIPDVAYTGTIMTENAFYPVFAFWAWATVRALQAPTVRRQLWVLGLLALAYFTRPQAVVLVPALVTALVMIVGLDVWAARDQPVTRSLVAAGRSYLTLIAGLGLAALAFVGVEIVARGKSWRDSLGAYSFLGDLHYSVKDVGRWFLYHVGEIDFAFVLLPFAALLLVVFVGLRPRVARELRVFAAVAISAAVWLILAVALFASTPYAMRILERSTFYIAPLCMVALVACVGRGLIWSYRTAAAAAAILSVGLVAIVQYSYFLGPNEPNDTFSLLTLHSVLERGWVALTQLQGLVIAGAVVAGLAFMLVPRRFGLVLPLLALLFLSLANGPVERRIRFASDQSRLGGVQARRDWIDRAVGSTKPDVATLWTGQRTFVTLWDNEFFNRSLGKVYYFDHPPDGLPETAVAVDPSNGALESAGVPVQAKYMLADGSSVVDGTPIARDPGLGMTVYRIGGPVRLQAQVVGLFADSWSGPSVVYRGYDCQGGHLTVTLLSDRDLHPRPETVVARSEDFVSKFVYRPGLTTRRMTVPLKAKNNICTVKFAIPTAVPLQVTGKGDNRALGIRFLRFSRSA